MGNIKKDNKEEKHYTPEVLIDEMFRLLHRNHFEPITSYLETSAGDGRICDKFDRPYTAFDIKNETLRSDIIEADYLKTHLPYQQGRVCIQNPPFNKGLKFVYKALEECDYVVSMLSYNSIMNIDYKKYWVEEIQLYRKLQFDKCKQSVVLIAIRKKREGELYDYEF